MRTALFHVIVAALIFLLPACSRPTRIDTLPLAAGAKTVEMNARSFDFDPDIILAREGDVLTLRVRNTSGMAHNITIEAPSGDVLVSRDLPEGLAAELEIRLASSGRYRYYCNRTMHPTLGMTGVIDVGK